MPSQMIRLEKLHENRYQEHPDWTLLRDFKPSVLFLFSPLLTCTIEGLKSVKTVQFGCSWYLFSCNFSFEMSFEHVETHKGLRFEFKAKKSSIAIFMIFAISNL